jgi:predicted transcriptional regulator
MACINVDGTLVASARKLLLTMLEPITVEEAAKRAELPLFRVRASLREFLQAGFVSEAKGSYVLTDAGRARLAGRG